MKKIDKFFPDKCPCSKTVEKSLFGLELLSGTIHKALTIDPNNCFERNRFNHSKSVNLARTEKNASQPTKITQSKKNLQARLPGFSLSLKRGFYITI